jgi:diketogulonate reductase-like aldo/keto reductase
MVFGIWNWFQLWNSDHGHVVEACKDSLKKLQLDYLDLYLVHFPVATRHTGMFHYCSFIEIVVVGLWKDWLIYINLDSDIYT